NLAKGDLNRTFGRYSTLVLARSRAADLRIDGSATAHSIYGTSMKTPKPDLREPPVYVVLIDNRGVITDVNTQGKPSARTDNAVVSQYTTGQSYLDHCRDDEHRAEVQALLKRKRTLISFVVSTRLQRQQRWFVVVGVPVGDIGGGAILMHIEITAWIPAGKDGGDASR